ncbi:hypothetical protein GCM10010440_62110 [Kitasatospora cinereorecta]
MGEPAKTAGPVPGIGGRPSPLFPEARRTPYAPVMTSTDLPEQDAPRFVRLTIELIAEITDEQALKAAALAQVAEDEYLDDDERAQSAEAIEVDPSGSLAHFIDPVALLGDVPGVELTSATWESANTDYDPDDESWDEYEVQE